MARIAGVNIPTNKRVLIALQYIHGIGQKNAKDIMAKVNIPMVGGKIEGLITDLISMGLREEKKVGRAWLDGNR